MTKERNVLIGRAIVDDLLKANEYRSEEIIAGIEGERFHTHDTHELVLLMTNNQASPELQIAAMSHDVERFAIQRTDAWYQGDRTGPAYVAYKKLHAEKGAAIMA